MTVFQRSLVSALVLLNMVPAPTLAQTRQEMESFAAEQDARDLLRKADSLADADASVDSILTAYEQALAAYQAFDYTDISLSIVSILVDLNYASCRNPQAVGWANQALELIEQKLPGRRFTVSDQLNQHGLWSQRLGDLYQATEQPDLALAAYQDGISYSAALPQSAITPPDWQQIAKFLNAQLPLLPADSAAATNTQERLVNTWQQASAITNVDGLLDSAEVLVEDGIPALALLASALDNSRRHRYQAGELRALLLSSKDAINRSEYDSASEHAQRAMTLTNNLRDGEHFENNALYLLAQAAWGKGDLQTAINHFTALLSTVSNSRASIYPDMGQTTPTRRTVVNNLVTLYQQTDQTAQAQALTSRYERETLQTDSIVYTWPAPYGEGNAFPTFDNNDVLLYQTCGQSGDENTVPIPKPSIRRPGR